MPLVFPALERNIQNHWNRAVLNLTQNVRNMFSEMDPELVLVCQQKFAEETSESTLAAERRRMTWERLENAASHQQPVANDVSSIIESAPCVVAC